MRWIVSLVWKIRYWMCRRRQQKLAEVQNIRWKQRWNGYFVRGGRW